MAIKMIFRENMENYLNKIKEKSPNARFYSFSKLGTFHNCKKEYYYTYIDKKEQRNNIYSILGNRCHGDLEMLYNNEIEEITPYKFNKEFKVSQMLGITFPKSKFDIAGNYNADIQNFYNIYSKLEGEEFISELGFILKIDGIKDRYLIGYIDLTIKNSDGTYSVVDFKTSSMYKNNEIDHKAYQLILYSMALEQLYGITIKDVSWEFLKFVDVNINGKTKTALEGKEWVGKCATNIKKLMIKNGINEFVANSYIENAINNNSIDNLPEEIKNKIVVNVHRKFYEVTEERKKDFTNYIVDSIKEIEENENKKKYWIKSSDSRFFCENLCGFYGKRCKGKKILTNKI